jgi:FMN-dependent oxidoreductase (nitrilotriacetate monooxygenase family)
MTKRTDHMCFGVFMTTTGHHQAGWRHPATATERAEDIHYCIELAQEAERAGLDMIFLADHMGGQINEGNRAEQSSVGVGAFFEPITLLSAIAMHTRNIGLVATATTTYYEPFILARLFASLDKISGGRAGWNVVTSSGTQEAANFGRTPHPDKDSRYDRAEEFVEVVKRLWESWEDDAFVYDKAGGRLFDPDKVHILGHEGKHFSVAGPLHVWRSAQGHPVIVQAGSSERGKELAARTAEVVFAAQAQLEAAQALYADIKGRMARYGRSPEALKIMPGYYPVIGSTEAEAQAKYDELDELILPQVTRHAMAHLFQCPDLLDYPLDEELPAWLEDYPGWSRGILLLDIARREKLTLRQLHRRASAGRGHHIKIGTPEQIADELEEWFDSRGADGFNLAPPVLPGGLIDFCEHVMPELRRRGRVREAYEGSTLRENLGLPFPTHPGTAETKKKATA